MTAPSPLRINGNSGSSTPARTPRSGTPVATHLSLGNKNSHKIREKTGYTDTRFAGKEEQFRSVVALLRTKGFIPAELIDNEVSHPNCRRWLTSVCRLAGFTTILALMMPILRRSLSRLLSTIFCRFTGQRLRRTLGMIQVLKFVLIERNEIMPSTLTPRNLVFPTLLVHNTNKGTLSTEISLILQNRCSLPQWIDSGSSIPSGDFPINGSHLCHQ